MRSHIAGTGTCSIRLHGRYTNTLPFLQAGIRFHAPAIDTYLTRAQQFLKRAEAQARIMSLKPAIKAHAFFFAINFDDFYASHKIP
jgi:hypothetical protein